MYSWYLSFRGARRHIPESRNPNWMYQGGSIGYKDAHCQCTCSVSSVSHERQVMYALKVELGVWRPVTQHSGWDGHQPVTACRIWLVMGPCHSSRVWLPALIVELRPESQASPPASCGGQIGAGICFSLSNSVFPCRLSFHC